MPVTINGSNTPTAGGVVYGDGTNYASTSAGTSGQVLTSAGSSSPTWTTPSAGALTLLATITPTVAANIDALTTFTSTYDNYLIVINGVTAATGTTAVLQMRYANAGVVDTTSVYGSNGPNTPDVNLNAAQFNITAGLDSINITNGRGISSTMNIMNVNATNSTFKAFFHQGIINGASSSGTNTYTPVNCFGAYRNTSAVSGVRFFWDTGANFAAQGKVRIYGVSNS